MIPVMRPYLGIEEQEAAAAAVASGWVAQGPRVAEFEAAMAQRVGAAHGVAVSSCTTGLHLALVAAGVGRDDEVVVPSMSFIATASVARYVGARPIFCDIDPATLNVTAETIAPVLTDRTRAVIVVHQAGCPADLRPIRELCQERGIAVIEDAACAIGAELYGEAVGGHSDFVVFSFHPRKIITTGEGGMVMVRSPEAAARLRRLREHGMSMSAAERHAAKGPVVEEYLEWGFNYRMTDIQAAIGLAQLAKLDEIIARRRYLAARYQEMLGAIPGLEMHQDPDYGLSNYQSFWINLPEGFPLDRNALLARLTENGVSARRGIMASHLEPAYEGVTHHPLPATERMTASSVILPLFHLMTEEEQDQVVGTILEVTGLSLRVAAA
jgi:dTDP-4-amino-4,6-dideoxygalactose transaminase